MEGRILRAIQEIVDLQYDGYGESIHPAEQISMIKTLLKQIPQRTEQ